MARFRITGGTPLEGTASVSGSKNGSLPLLAAALLVDDEVVLHNIPAISDIKTMIRMLRALGARAEFREDGGLVIDGSSVNSVSAPYDLVRRMRGSFYVAGPLLARFGEAQVPLPGGCVIGSRPVDFHVRGFKALGAEVEEKYGVMHATAKRLRGTRIYMDPRLRSVGATVNLMLAASLADGKTVIENASREPEVVDCQEFLAACGARIDGIGTTTLEITGVDRLHGAEWSAIPDRMEAGTYLIAGALTRGDVTIEPVEPDHLRMVTEMLQQTGCSVEFSDRRVRLRMDSRPLAVDVMTAPYPGYPTDLQPNTGVLMSIARGASVVEETIFDARFNYVDELLRMGADVRVMEGAAIFKGVPQLFGAPVVATDIRAGAALILAGLCAEGVTEISGGTLVDRGYEDITAKLRGLGAHIEALPEADPDAADAECLP
ncbi:MAG: UDP-N-acetylglucosamine 1-carboxyvinyltransferase [candidate division WS1 bacterium]|jgi:UDP-N-acetylglucosamine 1-carboxyvinyltransferase|nr:UDP-N-acetylglucosamine 1-carboxyvinyltransferase [candidate division WS1 bacterium]